jgi:hypothetical protein
VFYLKSQTVNDKGEKIIICHIHSACCKQDLFFIEKDDGSYIDAMSGQSATDGQTKSINNAKRLGLIWKG